MKLLTKELEKRFKKVGCQEGALEEMILNQWKFGQTTMSICYMVYQQQTKNKTNFLEPIKCLLAQ